MGDTTLESPVAAVFGRATVTRKRVEDDLGLRTVGDLLWHLPRRYLETQGDTELGALTEGQDLMVVAKVLATDVRSHRARPRLAFRTTVRLATAGGGPTLEATFFAKNGPHAESLAADMPPGSRGVFTGRTKQFRSQWQLSSPHKVMFEGSPAQVDPAVAETLRGLLPVYRVSGKIDSFTILTAVRTALDMVGEIPDPLDRADRERFDVLDLTTAFQWVHAPADWAQLTRAQQRFRFSEALITQLVLARRRAAVRRLGARARTGGGGLLEAFDARLPFTLTAGQREVGADVEADLARDHPMNRLLQGEVGSGKTLVALRAMLRVVDSGGQAALLAPTEVLAQQHHRSITAMLGDLASGGMLGGHPDGTAVELLTGSMTKGQRREPLLRIASGEAGLVIGTHALLEDHVSFADLGLVVVDEQHRFGVEQRAALTDKAGTPPHVLVMTATPIPRTVAMTVFGDLETSVLAELPAGRAPIQTNVVPLADQPRWLDRAWERVREEVGKGHQAYVVCPRITAGEQEEGESDPSQAADDADWFDEPVDEAPKRTLAAVEEVAPLLAEGPLAGLRVATLHGRMPPEEKDRTMRAFAAGEIDVLVSTTVIEVGVDVANATTMVLLDADRFGVSQLHQLRGRVGRGGLPGLCLLVSYAEAQTPARERLAAVAATSDGFELSRVDLAQRREGDVLGRSQSGFRSGLQSLRVLRDEKTIVAAREAAVAMLDEDPDLTTRPALAAGVAELEASTASEFMDRS
ncbi:ATP-dependent DNA helicase RecG [uncultured Nocardioides sp.]|uniref:ATP-dependent DNA helicase RecG n=1 Tax=uncultured Nocardioides sp. TaxID=198441 RepID=UPI0026063C9B|nr:ATP-dependent DNA helicase RecG [uncultured Nocardioides sp.]